MGALTVAELIAFIAKLLGFGADNLSVNKTLGVFNYAALLPIFIWVYKHHAEQITFSLDIGTLTGMVCVVFIWLEFNRRA